MLCGCASPAKKFEARKQERYEAYAALSPEMKAIVDKGEIKVGMTEDAVYIAWGPPAQTLKGESGGAATTTWLYAGIYMQEYRYWSYRPYWGRYYHSYSPYLEYDYYPRGYTRAEVVFENGVVKQWRSLPRPY
jgi:hypothetical protein